MEAQPERAIAIQVARKGTTTGTECLLMSFAYTRAHPDDKDSPRDLEQIGSERVARVWVVVARPAADEQASLAPHDRRDQPGDVGITRRREAIEAERTVRPGGEYPVETEDMVVHQASWPRSRGPREGDDSVVDEPVDLPHGDDAYPPRLVDLTSLRAEGASSTGP